MYDNTNVLLTVIVPSLSKNMTLSQLMNPDLFLLQHWRAKSVEHGMA